VLKNSGAYGPTNWASAISVGPSDESAQTLAFTVTANTNASLFSAAPAVNAQGQLSFTPATNQFGTTQITVQAQDNGGIANSGQNTSAAQVFTITVQSAPIITSAATAVFPLNSASSFTITTTGLPDVNSITLTANPGPGACTLPAGVTISYTSGTTAILSGTATSSTAVSCLVTASNGINPPATQVLSIIPGTPPQLLDDNFILLRGSASPASPSQWNVFADNGNGVDDLGVPAGAVASFGGGSLGGTSASNTPGATAITIPSSGGITVALLANGDLFVDAIAGTAVNGTYTFDCVVQNAADTDVATVTIIVGAAPAIAGSPPTSATIGGAYGPFTFSPLTGSPSPTVSLVSGSCTLPSGITLSSAGTLSGTPTIGAASASSCVARATNVFGTANSTPFSISVTVPAPTVTASGGATTFTEDGGAVVVDSGVTVTSAGTTDLTGATVTIGTGFESGQDVLSCTPSGGVNCVFSGNVLTLSGTAPVATYQTVLRTVRFNNPSQNPSLTARTVAFAATNTGGTSPASNKTVNVVGVNDPPSFTKGADQTVNEDAGAQMVNPWATAISDGDGGGQTLTFNITGNTNAALFSAAPSISSAGVLTYTPAANANGSATITVTLSDSGSNVAPNVNTSASQQFTITVNAVNDLPVAQTKNGGNVQANMRRVGIDASLLTGVTDIDNGINGCVSTTFSVASITSGTNGTVSNVNLIAGTFDFEPTAGFTGAATVNYTVSDTGCPGPAATSAAATINLTVVGPVIWFLDPAAATNGDGRLGTPFNSLASANTAKGTNINNRIFVYTGTTTAGTGVSLTGDAAQSTAQWLIGQGATGASFDALMGITPPTGTIARPLIGGTRPTLQGTVTLNGNNVKAQGFNLSTGASTGVNDAAGAVTGVSVSEVSVTSTSGTAVSLSDIGGSVSFTAVSSTAAANGILLQNSTGSFAVTGSSSGLCGGGVSSATPPATTVAPVTADCTGGSILSSTGAGVSLINASNVSLTRMRIANGADDGIRGDRVNGFTLASSLVESNGPVASPTFFNNLDFGDDRSGGYASGWVGLTGTASITNSTIRNGSNNNILIRSRDTAGGTLNLTMTGSVISGNPANDFMNDGVLLESGESANMNATITGNHFSASKGDHFQMAALNSGDFNVALRNNTFAGGHSTALGQGVTISAATGVPGYNGSGVYDVDGNVFNGSISNSVAVVLGTSASTASFVGKVRNNTIGTTGVALSCSTQAAGVYIDARGNGTHTSAVTNNVIRQCSDRGMLAEAGDGDSVLNLTVTGNTIDQQVEAGAREAIQTNFGITSTNVFGNVDTPAVCLQLGGAGALANTFSHGGGALDDFRLRKRQEATVRLPGYVGGTDQTAGSLAAVVAFIQGQNTGSAGEPGSASASGTGGGYTGGAACPTPP
jgi:large repetitive protein